MSLIKWEPFTDIENMFDSFHRFTKLGNDLAVDVYEKDNNIIAEMSLPGIDPDKINISVENNYLCISGSREEAKEEVKKHYYSKEIRRGTFERVVHLPSKVEEDRVTAEFKNGELTITMPKTKELVSNKIKIEVKK